MTGRGVLFPIIFAATVFLGPYHRGRETRFHVFFYCILPEFGNLGGAKP